MDDYDDTARQSDFCIKCNDSISWVGYMGLWMSETQLENCGVCPKGDKHEPSYSV